MADIAMCTNEECPSRKICYRAMDKYQIAERRLYIDFAHRVHEALKPGTKMWQKESKQYLCWPDPIRLIEWLTKKAKKG